MPNQECEFLSLKQGHLAPKPPKPKSEEEIISEWEGNPKAPVVSIVCHTFNHKAFIEDALNGFLMQETTFPFEVIVHDDASGDGTTQIVSNYALRYPNIIKAIFQVENQWSKGIRPRGYTFPLVKGRYITLCEGDDFWISSDKLERQVREFQSGVALVFHDAIREKAGEIFEGTYYGSGSRPVNGYSPHQMAKGCVIPTASSMFLASAFRGKNQPNIINGDQFIWAICAKFGRAVFVDGVWSVYRHHSGGVWSSRPVVDQVAPALDSKKVIFNNVAKKHRISALFSECKVCVGYLLIPEVRSEKTLRNMLTKRLFECLFMRLFLCRVSSKEGLMDFFRILYLTFIRLPLGVLARPRAGE
jgi:glycosyltransferase involved in cell wall biosynthesis